MIATLKFLMSVLFAVLLAFPAIAQSQADYPEAVETRAREVGRQLRCVVCQNQSIEESDAALAADMRKMVRDRLVAGDSEADIIALMRDRYGDYVLLLPPVQGNTIILWAGPAVLLLLLLLWWVISIRRKPQQATAPIETLSDEDEAKLAALRKADT